MHDEKTLSQSIFVMVKENILSASDVKEVKTLDEVVEGVLSGDAALFIDGFDIVLLINVKGWATRNIQETATEAVIRGPREGFIEDLSTNIALLRRKIKNPNIIFESLNMGKQTHTDVCIAYIAGIANIKIVEEVRNRLNRIDTDAVLESGYLEQFIEDNPFSPFSTIGNSEKPDIVAAKLLEGRVAIFCDGTPFVLTVPHLFIEMMQSSEDYYSRPFLSSLTRLLRYLSFFVTMTVPALYVALQTFHHEMIPTVLLITAAAAREGIPFPAFLEAMVIGIIFELLRESGVRMPRPVGQAVSIVGALVIGEAAIQAGIISAPMVIIAALTGITSFIVPSALDALVFFRLFLLLLSATFGLYGIVAGLIIILAHTCSLRSFGTPFLTPLAPTRWKELMDSFIRGPLWLIKSRPQSITWRSNSNRQASSLMPSKPDKYDRGDDRGDHR